MYLYYLYSTCTLTVTFVIRWGKMCSNWLDSIYYGLLKPSRAEQGRAFLFFSFLFFSLEPSAKWSLLIGSIHFWQQNQHRK